jgi:hypothetical protein
MEKVTRPAVRTPKRDTLYSDVEANSPKPWVFARHPNTLFFVKDGLPIIDERPGNQLVPKLALSFDK